MNVKQPAALDDEPHFVLVVPVLGVELREHRVEARRVGLDVDDVGGDVAAARLELVDLAGVRREHLRPAMRAAAISAPTVVRSKSMPRSAR